MSLFLNTNKRVSIYLLPIVILLIILVIHEIRTIQNTNNSINITPAVKLEETTQVFDPDMLNFSITSDIIVDNKSYSGMANIMNIQNANEYFIVDIKLEDTGETIYKSPKISNHETIDVIEIDKHLDTGTHNATASFNAYNKNTDEYITTVALNIDVTVISTL